MQLGRSPLSWARRLAGAWRCRVPAAVLIAFLQRTPAVRIASAISEVALRAPLGSLIKAAAASISALGAVDTLAGATQFSLTTGSPGHPSPYSVTSGSQIEPVSFAFTEIPLTGATAGSWKLISTLPPGLKFGSETTFITGPGVLNQNFPMLFGTPTSPGSYTIELEAFQAVDADPTFQASGVFTYQVIVNGGFGFSVQPISVAVAGGTVALDAVVAGPATYQWFLNGSTPVAGATSTLLELPDAASAAGTYTCVATSSQGVSTSDPATVSVQATNSPGRIVNLSTRASSGTGGNVLIAGFAISGAGAEPLLIRASGPALIPLGVGGVLPDPQLQLFSGSSVLATNNGWAGNPTIASEASAVGAFTWSNAASHDSALATSLGAGPYTAQVSGQSGDTGVALAEVYDATPASALTPSSPGLTNISARVIVGTGGNVLIAGFAIGGDTAVTVLVRASGPALIPFGVTGTLSDPQLQLFSGSTVLASNSGWGGDGQIASTAGRVGAFAWTSTTSTDSAILITLPPGAYTAQVSGASGDTGVALVEVYLVR